MSVRKRKWVTSKGGEREAWIADYTDQAGDATSKLLTERRTPMLGMMGCGSR